MASFLLDHERRALAEQCWYFNMHPIPVHVAIKLLHFQEQDGILDAVQRRGMLRHADLKLSFLLPSCVLPLVPF